MKPVLQMSTEEVERFFGTREIHSLRKRDAELQALREVKGENLALNSLFVRLGGEREMLILEIARQYKCIAPNLTDLASHLSGEHRFVEIERSPHGFRRAKSPSSVLQSPKEAYFCGGSCGWVRGKPVVYGFWRNAVFLCLMCGGRIGHWQPGEETWGLVEYAQREESIYST